MKEKCNSISLAKFLSRYKSLYGKDLKKLTHDDVKVLFPDLKRCSFDTLKEDPCLLYIGEVSLVSDGHKTIPYYNPVNEIFDEEYMEFVYDNQEESHHTQYYDYTSMSIYQLKQLLHDKFSSCRQRHLAKKELIDRGAILKRKYNRTLEKRKKFEEE